MDEFLSFTSPDSTDAPTHLLKTEALMDGNFMSLRFVTVSHSDTILRALCIRVATKTAPTASEWSYKYGSPFLSVSSGLFFR